MEIPGTDIRIKELDLEILAPLTSKFEDPEYAGGSKFVFIGKPNTGKSSAIKALLYSKRHIFPVGVAMNGSEEINHMYCEFMPSTFVFNTYDEEKIEEILKRQTVAKKHLPNPWAVLILDDCTDDPKVFNRKIQRSIWKRGRHMSLMYIVSLQYSMDIKPDIRTAIDGTFIFREPLLKNRRSMYENFASIIPSFDMFCMLMDQLTGDYQCLYIHNNTTSNNWEECVYYFKADIAPKSWKLGCPEYWQFHEDRYNRDYVDPVM